MKPPPRLELEEGEQLLWSDSPDPWLLFLRQLPATTVGLVMFVIGADYFLHRRGTSLFNDAFHAFYTFAALCAVVSPWTNRRRVRETTYAITNRRAILVDTAGTQSVTRPDWISRRDLRDGRGDITISLKNVSTLHFEGIENPRETERLARGLRAPVPVFPQRRGTDDPVERELDEGEEILWRGFPGLNYPRRTTASANSASSVFYAVTNRRVLFVDATGTGALVHSLWRPPRCIYQWPDGASDIIFRESRRRGPRSVAFYRVDHALQVETLILAIADKTT